MAIEQGRRASRNRPRANSRRTELLDAAVKNIAKKGARGLRVEEVAREAGVSTALIYHYFPDRSALLQAALLHVADRADKYTASDPGTPAREELISVLLAEIQDRPEVQENSAAWGELRDTAIFDRALGRTLSRYYVQWVDELGQIVRRGIADGSIPEKIDVTRTCQRLTALVEGLSGRWLAGIIPTDQARSLLEEGAAKELA